MIDNRTAVFCLRVEISQAEIVLQAYVPSQLTRAGLVGYSHLCSAVIRRSRGWNTPVGTLLGLLIKFQWPSLLCAFGWMITSFSL